jgi:hypothetical protein
MAKKGWARPGWFFRLVYRCLYFLLYLVLLGLLLITPIDAVERSIQNRQTYNIFLLIIVYAVTILVVSFIYVVRLYINKTVLQSIPRAWIPIEIGDVPRTVYWVIAAGLSRSAAIAFEARPRVGRELAWAKPVDETVDDAAQGARPRARTSSLTHPPKTEGTAAASQLSPEGLGISTAVQRALWSEIEHPGWASPTSPDLPNLQYATVVAELPNLIEAKALTLAPPDAMSQDAANQALDPEALQLLQRPPNMSLRGYLAHLTSLGVLEDPSNVDNEDNEANIEDGGSGRGGSAMPTTALFLQEYEYARFSTRPLSNAQFRHLMHLFAELLRGMQPMDLDALASDGSSSYFAGVGHGANGDEHDGGDDNGGAYDTGSVLETSMYTDAYEAAHDADRSSTPRSNFSLSRSATMSTQNSVRRHPVSLAPPQPQRSTSWGRYRTAPNTPSLHHAMTRRLSNGSDNGDGDSEGNTFAQTRQPFRGPSPSTGSSVASSVSLRSHGSSSVIRLATRDDDEERPYVLNLRPTMDSWGTMGGR